MCTWINDAMHIKAYLENALFLSSLGSDLGMWRQIRQSFLRLLLVIRHPVTDSGFNQLGVTPAYWSFGLYDSLSWAGNLNGLRYIF